MTTLKKSLAILLIIAAGFTGCSKKVQEPNSTLPVESSSLKEISLGTEKNDSISAGETKWYFVKTTAGKYYSFKWNDNYEGDNSKTADIFVSAYKKDQNSIVFYFEDSGYLTPKIVTATEDLINIKVIGYENSAGTYSIKIEAMN